MVDKPVQFVARGRFFQNVRQILLKCPIAIPDITFQAILFDKWSVTCMIVIKTLVK